MTGVVSVRPACPEDAAAVVGVVHAGFGARPLLDPPATAPDETADSVRAALEQHGGLLAVVRDRPVGAMLFEPAGRLLGLRRVAVHPSAQGVGVAGALVAEAEKVAGARAYDGLSLTARAELPSTVRFWRHQGYVEVGRDGVFLTMAKLLPVVLLSTTGDQTRQVGERLARLLRAGDLVILNGDLGSGKTTLTQGIGDGLGVRGPVTSPTFVISRVHPPLADGPALVHVDAYRLGGIEELDDLDLDASLDEAVTVVEWGEDVAEGLADDRLEVSIHRAHADEPSENRTLSLQAVGSRWLGAGLREALA